MDYTTFRLICKKAHEAGLAAVEAATIVPMIVGQETSFMSGKIDKTKPTYFIEDGVCGFAWVDVFPTHKGNTKLGREERRILEQCGFDKSYDGPKYYKWISDFNQSMQKKEIYARAYAKVLRENGIKAYEGSRLD